MSANNPNTGTVVGPATASCPAGTVVLGGGADVTVAPAGQDGRAATRSSYPSSASQWTAVGTVIQNINGGRRVTVTPYVLCSA